MKPSIRLISEIAGVSMATVSNALHNKRGVNRQTAKRVLAAARECGYLPEPVLQGIRLVLYKTSSQVLGNTPLFSALIEGIEKESRASQLETTLFPLEKGSPEFPRRIGELLNDRNYAILLLATEMSEADARVFRCALAPVVILDNWLEESDFDSVLIANTDSACKIVEYLIQNGHRQIGYLKSRVRIQNYHDREQGYLRALSKHGIPPRPEYCFSLTPALEGAFTDMKRQLAANPALPTAFFADNDLLALGAMQALRGQGIRVPEEVSIAGFGGLPLCGISAPALTTVQVNCQAMGIAAVRKVLEVSEQRFPAKTKTQICAKLVERESVRLLL